MIKSFFIKSLVVLTSLVVSLNAFSTNYYVNDSSLVGDVFTSAIGNNGNLGTAASPFATLTHLVNTVGLVSGDTVFIDAGNYIQTDANLSLNINNTHFVGAGYSLTIFDNQAASADANRWATITGNNISVIGMKITKYNYGLSDGTAIFVNGATNLLIQNVLTDENKPGGGGSSIYITNSSSVSLIGGGANCNTAVSLTGGGVKIYGAGNIVSFDNYSFSNNSKDYEQGSGLHVDGTPTTFVTVRNSIFADNRNLVGSAGGAAIYLSGSNLSVYGSCFKDNVSGSVTTVYGGAISVGRGATLNISNCSFINNTAGGTGKGGAISINTSFDDFGSGSAAVVNVDSCSFSLNSSGEGADLYARVGSGHSATFNINQSTFSGTTLDIRDDNTAAINIQNSGNPSATGAGINKINTNPASVFPITSCPLLVGSCYAAPCINPTPTGSAAQSFCLTNNPTVVNLSAIGGTILWYSSANLGTALATNTPLVNGQTYYASDETVGCDPSDPRFAVTVTLVSGPPSAGGNGTLTICSGTTVIEAQLFASLTGSPAVGGVWTPVLAGAGTYTYTHAATSPCTTDSTATVLVSEQALPPSAGGNGTLTICSGTTVTAAQLFASLTGSPAVGGVWTPVLAGAGTYTYTHAATSPCIIDSTAIVTVSEFPFVLADAGSNSYTICTGDSVQLGIVAVPGVIYSWSPIINLSNPNSSNPFAFPNDTTTYYLTASQNGCLATDSVVVNSNELPDLDASLIFIQNSNCGNNNGSITGLSASGYPTLTYSWTNGSTQVSTDIDLLNQISGSYNLTVTDGNLCSKSFGPFNISDIGAPTIDLTNIVVTPDTCGKSMGSIVGIAVSGGIAPLSFEWVLGADTIGNTLDLNNLVAGNYVLFVTDSAGCITVSGPFSVAEISGPTLIETFANVLDDHCGQSIGTITGITSNGGTGVLTYSWSNGTIEVGTALDLTNLPSGNYDLTVTDAVGCQATGSSYLINDIAGPSLDTTLMLVGDAACGGSDGQITNVSATGGIFPYSWSWFEGSTLVGISQNLIGVTSGNYSVVVTDSFGCVDSIGTIAILDGLAATIDAISSSITDASCNTSNGSITGITVSGGTLPYTYSWSDGTLEVSTSLDLTGMPFGTYSLTVTDSNGCQSTAGHFIINQSNPATIDVSSISVIDASCNGSNGSITGITVTGGTLPYIYSWSNGIVEVSTSLDLTNMPLGIYILTVTDSNGCQSQTSPINIIGGNPPTINTTNLSVVNANCNTINGSISNISISGGVQPYSYQWTNNGTVVGTNLDLSLIDMGWYILTVTDSLGCSSTDSVFVDRDLINNILANDDYVTTQQNLGVQISPLINDLGSSSLIILNGPINGTASGSVFYTPNTGYFGFDSILYEICDVVCTTICDTATIYIEIEKERRIRIYDGFSPNGDGSNETFYIENIEFFPENELLIYSRWGDLVYSAKPYNNEWDGSSKTNGVKLIGNKVVDGTYFFILKLTPESEAINGTIDLRR